MFTTGETVGLVEWIIDDTCLVMFILTPLIPINKIVDIMRPANL